MDLYEEGKALEVGDVVWRKGGSQLRSGCKIYYTAIVISVDPFALASYQGDMLWQATVKPEDFEAIAAAPMDWYTNAMRRLPDVRQDVAG